MNSESMLPLTETTFYILLSLTPGKKHGYAIMKDVRSLSEGHVTLSTSTLYGALKRLLEQDWIERVDDPDEEANGNRERKAYTLTRLGKRILEMETCRLQAQLAAARRYSAEATK
jgi:DNA-binding PadR family transcriptional regulator